MATPCGDLVGVKNIAMTFYDCNTNTKIGPVAHKLSSNDLPTVRTCGVKNEALPGGFTKRQEDSPMMKLKIIRDLRLPISFYQGCAGITISIEYLNGLVYTGVNGGVTNSSDSDTHEADIEATFTVIDELLPAGALISG